MAVAGWFIAAVMVPLNPATAVVVVVLRKRGTRMVDSFHGVSSKSMSLTIRLAWWTMLEPRILYICDGPLCRKIDGEWFGKHQLQPVAAAWVIDDLSAPPPLCEGKAVKGDWVPRGVDS